MILLPQLSAIRLDGKDAGGFLHNQVSADVLALKDGEATFACYCEPKGRVLALMLIGKSGESYHVLLNASLAAGIAARLKIYVMRANVGIEVLEDCRIAGLAGAEAANTDEAITTLPVPGDVRQLSILPAGASLSLDEEESALLCNSARRLPE